MQIESNPSYSCFPYSSFEGVCDERTTRLFWSIIKGALLGAAAGACLFAGVQVLAILAVGAVGGAVISFVLTYLGIQQEEAIAQRISHLDGLPQSEVVDRIRRVASQGHIQFTQSSENHLLHHDLVVLTDQVKHHADLSTTFRAFLDALEGTYVTYSDGTQVTLDFTLERERLDGGNIPFTVEQLQRGAPQLDEDLAQIVAIENECFGYHEARKIGSLQERINTPGSGFFVARRNGSREILGYFFYRREVIATSPQLHISGVGRKAGAARLGIADALFAELQRHKPQGMPVVLEVRENNAPAIALYQRAGFQNTGTVRNYYQFPNENALTMRLA
jgi:ribosomal-protein-alanine N-acetyltransferase